MNEANRLSRRTALRGLGATVALPLLEAMLPRASAAAQEKPPVRMAFFYLPNGMHMPDWVPADEGPLKQLPPILAPLEKHKESLLVLSELTLNGGRPLGDGAGDHARAVASFLTGAHPYKTNGKDFRNGVSVDQTAAAKVGHLTRFASLELGCEPSAQAGNCDSGYSCVYTSNMAWRTPTSPLTKETNPRAVFDRLFGGGSDAAGRQADERRRRRRKSVLDFVAEDASALRRRLGAADHRKLDEYLYAVRDLERRVEQVEALDREAARAPGLERPAGVPGQFEEHVALMLDLMAAAFQTDSTRIVTCMYTNAGSNRSYPTIGVRSGHHELSHHGRNAEKQAQIAKINRHHVSLLAKFLDKLATIREQDQTLLDRAMILYGSGIGDGDRHNHDNLPILLAGRGGGTIRPGRHLRAAKETPLTNLYLAMLERMGVRERVFSDSTGPLEGLG